ncbi:cadherin-like domain-containing protein [Mycobacterium sp. Y57]|uniref:Ig-like domain-containing protein n=1 Tax=Mycolicibacterium xanthum TaxID=2796469 RepID=UPI001C8595B4|nr:Ig-like domain-containing protein [Mycolicibacterium xanthum]MBX7432616.1 cadherin-like domain-containing protein [Mycolicibacterium xanthum]
MADATTNTRSSRRGRRRARDMAVTRWLRLGAASAGVTAALLGYSLAGPDPTIAAADEPVSASTVQAGDSGSTAESDDSAGGGAGDSKGSDVEDADDAADAGELAADADVDELAADADVDELAADLDAADADKDPAEVDAADADADVEELVTEVAESDDAADDPHIDNTYAGAHEGDGTDDVAADGSPSVPADGTVATENPADVVAESATAAAVAPAAVAHADEPSMRHYAVVDQPLTQRAGLVAELPTQNVPVALAAAPPAPATATLTVGATIDHLMGLAQAWIDRLPVSDSFKEFLSGALYLTRRTWFNQAPTVAPIQLTGRLDGPITGTIGAVDPEGDPICYRVVSGPQFGGVTLADDGTYTYTPDTGFDGVDTFTVAAQDGGLHVNLLAWFRPTSTKAGVVINQRAITVEFRDGAGAEFWSPEAREALREVAESLGAYIVVPAPVTLTFTLEGENVSGRSLASAGSDWAGPSAGFIQTVVQQKLITGVDPNGDDADGEIMFNFGQPWALGDAVGSDEFDFTAVALHELLHTLGFLSNLNAPGKNTGTHWTVMDGLIVTAEGTSTFTTGFAWDTDFDATLTGGDGGLFFGGAHAVAVYGALVPLFSPSPWAGGSSASHLDDETFTGADEKLMNAYSDRGPSVRVISPLELAMLQDLGYTVVPQTSSAVFVVLGLVLLRRRRRGAESDTL